MRVKCSLATTPGRARLPLIIAVAIICEALVLLVAMTLGKFLPLFESQFMHL